MSAWLALAGTLAAAEGTNQYAKLEKVELTPYQSGLIARAAGMMLEVSHYRQTPFNDAMSRQFFTNYVNLLDYNHMFFLQPDVDEFAARYANRLDDLTKTEDASPALVIYERFKERVKERQEFIDRLLKREFSFDTDEYFEVQRNKLPWPATQAEAEDLWTRRVKHDLLVGRLNKDDPEETLKVVTKRFNRLTKALTGFDSEEVLGIYLDALGNAFDPHTDYMTPSERRNFEIHNIKSELIGIGALLQSEDGYCKIKSLTPGGPAEKSKQLGPNDRIVAVAQGEDGEWVDVVEEKLNNVVEIIRGELGTTVRLEIIPAKSTGSERKTVKLVRDVIQIKDQLPKARLHVVPGPGKAESRLGVITLPQFHDRAADDVAKLVTRLEKEKIDGLVLDLRRNGGGILEQAIRLTGLFIDAGPVVQVKNNEGQQGVLGDSQRGALYEGPLIVLVSHLSASASEIVAAALQDFDRALIIGDHHTHGKGTVQTLVGLEPFMRPDQVKEPGSLKFTVQKFYRIAGGTTQKYGVIPDYTLPSTLDYLELGEVNLPNALEADEISPARYRPMNMAKLHVDKLAAASRERIAKDQDFAYLQEDIELLKKQLEDRRVSLNEEKRLAEKAEAEERREARKAERLARVNNDTNIFEIDLQGVDAGKEMLSLAVLKVKEGDQLASVENKRAKDEVNLDDEDDGEAKDEEADDTVDPHLNETLNILRDYIRLMNGASLASAAPAATPAKSATPIPGTAAQ